MTFILQPIKAVARTVAQLAYGGPVERVLTREQREHWDQRGFLVLPGHFSAAAVDVLNAHVDEMWRSSRQTRRRTVVDVFIDTPRGRRILLNDAPLEARSRPYKLNDLYLESDVVRRMVLEQRLASIVADLLDGHPLVCNTLNLEFGSQQRDHTDSLYMTAPDRQHLVASWIALEEGSPDSGPLRYYPGSHAIPPFRFSTGDIAAVYAEMPNYYEYMASELARRGLKAEIFIPNAGDVFIWHGQLYHGGEPIRDPSLTRKSLVTHYWRAQDVPGVHGRLRTGHYWFRRQPQPVNGSADDH